MNEFSSQIRRCNVSRGIAPQIVPGRAIPGHHSERDVVQWLERGALPKSLPAVRFQILLGAGFSEKYHVSRPFNNGTLFRCCVLGQGTLPSNAPLDLVGQRWQCERLALK